MNTAIPEDDYEFADSKQAVEYRLDLGAGSLGSTPALTPQSSFSNLRRPIPARAFRPPRGVVGTRRARERREKEAERDCAICFELAVAPVRTHCCSQLLCGEHITSYLADPRSDGRCPACSAPPASFTYASLGHPAQVPKDAPQAPPPSRAPTPPPFDVPASVAPYAAYPSLPVTRLPALTPPRTRITTRKRRAPSPATSNSSAGATIVPARPAEHITPTTTTDEDDDDAWEDEPFSPTGGGTCDDTYADDEEDRTLSSSSWTLPALVRARALQTRRHASHPFTNVLGLRGVLICALRIAVWVGVVGILAGRWQAANAGGNDGRETEA